MYQSTHSGIGYRLPYVAPCITEQYQLTRRSLLETFSLEATFQDFEEDENADL